MIEEDTLIQQELQDVAYRTSSNNMLALVEYIPLSDEEQKLVDAIFTVAA